MNLKKNLFTLATIASLALMLSCDLVDSPSDTTTPVPIIQQMNGVQTVIRPGDTLHLHCVASDPSGLGISYFWTANTGTFLGSQAGDSAVWRAPIVETTATIKVKVYNEEASATDSFSVEVTRELNNTPPVIQIVTVDPGTLYAYTDATLLCLATDPEGDLLTYEWSAGEGEFVTATDRTSVRWRAPVESGLYDVKVTVSDGYATAEQSSTLKVIDWPPMPEVRPVFPTDDMDSVFVDFTLKWSCTDSSFYSGDDFQYQIYFGTTSPPPPLVREGYQDTVLTADSLSAWTGVEPEHFTRYFWRVVAVGVAGDERSGSVWSFETGQTQIEKLREIFPITTGNWWEYNTVVYSESGYNGEITSRDVNRAFQTMKVTESTNEMETPESRRAFRLEGVGFNDWFTYASNGLYIWNESQGVWEEFEHLIEYPQPTGSSLVWGVWVLNADTTIESSGTQFEHCYVVSVHSEDPGTGNTSYSYDGEFYYAPGYGPILHRESSYRYYYPDDSWDISETTRTLVDYHLVE